MSRARFITFEGIDGAGKSSHIAHAAQWLREQGLTVHTTREPGGTPLGEQLRELLLHQQMHLETETLLMFAARREHLAQLIVPALERGEWVISDRFTDASFAYQGGGRQMDLHKLEVLEQWVHPTLQPDLTLLFDVPLEVARQRLDATREQDRFEQEKADFFERVRQAYLQRALAHPQRFCVLDSTREFSQVRASMVQAMQQLMEHA